MIKKINEIGAWDVLINLENPKIAPYLEGYNFQKPVFGNGKYGIGYGMLLKREGTVDKQEYALRADPWKSLLSTFASDSNEMARLEFDYFPIQKFNVKTIMGIIDQDGERAFPYSISTVDFDPSVVDIRMIDENNYFIASRMVLPSKQEKLVWQHINLEGRKPIIAHNRLAVVDPNQQVYFDKGEGNIYQVSVVNQHDYLRNVSRLYDLDKETFITPVYTELVPKSLGGYFATEVVKSQDNKIVFSDKQPVTIQSELTSQGEFCGWAEVASLGIKMPSTKYSDSEVRQKVYQKVNQL